MDSSPPSPTRRWLFIAGWLLVALMPVLYIAARVIASSRNIVFWDEFDTALDLILRIDAGAGWRELLQRFVAINNEHRTVTSRLMFASSYWLTGTVNFHVIGAIGNLFHVTTCLLLIFAVDGWIRRIRMAVVLAFLMFQLEHFESFIWSGSSIDHFQVVTLGVGATVALAHRSRGALLVGIALAVAANFTLAQGSVVWATGALLLLHQRRWTHLAAWVACGILCVAAFLHGFKFNPGHNIATFSGLRLAHVVRYWFALLGAPLTLGDAAFAIVPGGALVAGYAVAIARGAAAREPVALFSGLFAIGALALIAFGRAELSGADVNSRYLVLGALAWALLLFMLLEFASPPERPFRLLALASPALAVFTIAADQKFAPYVDAFVEVRDRAATSFMQYGEDGRGVTRLHPQQRHADILLRMAEERGVYRLPSVSHRTSHANPQRSSRIIVHFDELVVNDRAVTAGGWAMIPGHRAQSGEIFLVLRSAGSTLYFSTVTLLRPDVAKAYNEPKWRKSGFRAVIERERLPAEDFDVGVLINGPDGPEFAMTENRLELAPNKPARAVTAAGR